MPILLVGTFDRLLANLLLAGGRHRWPHDHEPVERPSAQTNPDPGGGRAQSGAQRFRTWVEELRAGDETFAEASGLYPPDVGEFQAAVYLLTGCPRVWRVLGPQVIERTSIAPVVRELERPTGAWSASEQAAIEWAAYFWDTDRAPPRVPYMVEQALFRRWIAALHLRQRLAPR